MTNSCTWQHIHTLKSRSAAMKYRTCLQQNIKCLIIFTNIKIKLSFRSYLTVVAAFPDIAGAFPVAAILVSWNRGVFWVIKPVPSGQNKTGGKNFSHDSPFFICSPFRPCYDLSQNDLVSTGLRVSHSTVLRKKPRDYGKFDNSRGNSRGGAPEAHHTFCARRKL